MLFNSLLLGSLVSLVTGAAVSKNPRDVLKNKVCNFECNKKCWSQGFDINTNHEDKWPITGKTRIVRRSPLPFPAFISPLHRMLCPRQILTNTTLSPAVPLGVDRTRRRMDWSRWCAKAGCHVGEWKQPGAGYPSK